jgi:hypothetical protein
MLGSGSHFRNRVARHMQRSYDVPLALSLCEMSQDFLVF